MTQRLKDAPEQVVKFAPKGKPRAEDDGMDQAGQAIVSLLQRAADLSNQNCDRAMDMAHKLSMQLRAAEDQINELRKQVAYFQDRAVRAETWMAVIQKEIEGKLLGPLGQKTAQ
jgi:hypothetical protein